MAIMTGPFHAFTDCNNIGDEESLFEKKNIEVIAQKFQLSKKYIFLILNVRYIVLKFKVIKTLS